jgi:uncharacterized protein YfdQ (DUF2303 family)
MKRLALANAAKTPLPSSAFEAELKIKNEREDERQTLSLRFKQRKAARDGFATGFACAG